MEAGSTTKKSKKKSRKKGKKKGKQQNDRAWNVVGTEAGSITQVISAGEGVLLSKMCRGATTQ